MKRILLQLLLVAFLACLFVAPVFSQAPTAKITLKAVSPNDTEADTTLKISAGLPNVGIGEIMYLLGNEGETDITGYTWEIVTKPDGSTAALSSTTAQNPTFTPDVQGQYKVQLTATSTGGTSEAVTLWLSAGKYVGVGTVGGTTPDYLKGQCALCHPSTATAWSGTKHATFFERMIDGETGYYASYCVSCHTVGYRTETGAVNDGFDDVASAAGWVFPTTLASGNWASMVANYPTVMEKANIQCENCHGAGSEHKAQTSKNQISYSMNEGVCNTCHEAEPYHLHSQQWANSKHATNTSYPTGESHSSCVPCHSGAGFISNNDKAYDELNTEYTHINCQTCHDPHEKDNDHQIRKLTSITLENDDVVSTGGYGMVCMNCHKSRQDADTYVTAYHSYYGPHHGPQTDMLFGKNAAEFGLSMGSSAHSSVVENTCSTCHMQSYDPHAGVSTIKTDVGNSSISDDFAKKLGDNMYGHSFWNSYVDSAGTRWDNTKACKSCHGDITSFDDIKANEDYDGDGTVEGVQSEVKGMLHHLAMYLPPMGDSTVTVTSSYTANQLKAAYNYLFVEEDGSYGVHNSAYAIGLLKAAINAVGEGDIGAGSIMSITDVPNDQGKQVRVMWGKFPGDGNGDPKITKYGIWRKVDESSGKVTQVSDYNEMFSQINTAEGSLFKTTTGEYWDFAGEVPANGMDVYSTIVSTVYDSTIADGQHLSYFKISGHGSNGTAVTSASASGYSIDNLAPATPGKVSVSIVAGVPTMTWEESSDADFNYFAVYRWPVSGTMPAEPTATTTSTSFKDEHLADGEYYFSVSAVDFSGNVGVASSGVKLTVTGIDPISGNVLPTEYSLSQNYPNPFNPTTEIAFQLPKASHVTIEIYNGLGVKIRTLINDQLSAGYKQLTWDGRDDNGRLVSSGIYIYRMKAESFNSVKKMVFLK